MTTPIQTSHETLAVIRERVSASHFDPTYSMDEAVIAELIGYACEAPSAYHLQNWRFIAVQSPENKQKLRELAYGQHQVFDAAVTIIVVGTLDGHERIRDNLQPLLKAGLMTADDLNAWADDTHRGMSGKPAKQRDEAIRSGALAAMNLMTAAQAIGLASAPMGGFDAAAVSTAFGIVSTEVPVMLVAIGRAAAGNWPRKPRRPVNDVLTFV
ncbi:nitroreductase family protein [Hydrogenophaga sp. 5NK40-0174]|uniref:nitroreductase family protein n=1 Tax=Hydrogenophaga sp. 5NK40-0174 TaxID=3127649 RepID=UPI00310682DD